MRGYQLRRWRYGPETEQLVAEALERDHWSSEQWKTFQENRLAFVLHRASTQVPYYSGQWSERRRKGDRASWEYLENWPILEKEQLRAQATTFVADDCDPRNMFHEHTSGTTGKPLDLWWSREAVRQWYALFEARIRRWHGVSWRENWITLGGQLVVPFSRKTPPYWVRNRQMNQMYLSSHHISPKTVKDYAEALKRFGPSHIIAYTSSAVLLARYAHDEGISFAGSLRAVITNAEPLLDWQRQILEQVFSCRIIETYGQAEAVAAASEDHDGRLRFWPESGLLEIVDDNDQAVPQGESGSFITTHLFNADMPLIRYRVGDRGVLSPQAQKSVHNRLPVIERIEGRNTDMLVAQDGRRVFWINPVLYNLPIQEAQIRQDAIGQITLLYVPAASFSEETKRTIQARLRERIGEVSVIFERVSQVPRETNGKFRAVICNLSPEELESVRHL